MDDNPQVNNNDAQAQDAQEWDQAGKDFTSNSGVEIEKKEDKTPPPKEDKSDDDKKDDSAGTAGAKKDDKDRDGPESAKAEKTDEKNKKDDEKVEKKPDEEAKKDDGGVEKKEGEESKKTDEKAKKEGDEVEKEELKEDQSDPVRDARSVQRALAADEKTVKKEIREKMFDDVKESLTDADGDPIRTIEDVQKLMNPNTGKQFTEHEAAQWLLQAQRNLDKRLESIDQQVDEIAEVNLSIKDEADTIKSKYGELLEANPNGIREKVWQAYEKTLVKDEKSGIIIKAPVSLSEFYDTTLAPYVKLAEQLENKAKENKAGEARVEEEKKKREQAERAQSKSDRSDIYSGGKSDTMDAEEKEWAKAGEVVFGDK